MAQFSAKERFIARLLSATPRLKGTIKSTYIRINYFLYRKKYKHKIHINQIKELHNIQPLNPADETFFGYYDKSPENSSEWVIFNETPISTAKKPTTNRELYVNAINLKTKEVITIPYTFSYNWQQGCRAQWINDTQLAYNSFDNSRYRCNLFDLPTRSIIASYDYPVQDSYQDLYFLSINYERVMRLRPDYGYRNLPLLTDVEMGKIDNDGIWKVDFKTSTSTLVVSLSQLASLSPKVTFNNAFHKVNHVMIAPDGKSFIFIHRWYDAGRRHDRLLWSDFNNIKILSDDDMVSHMCWINPTTIFGYLRHNNEDGFYFIDLQANIFTECSPFNQLKTGDGHPSYNNGRIIIDTYPDKSRMQHLYLYDIKEDKIHYLLELFQSVRYHGESRCDLHPRFSPDGNRIYFDSVYLGKRTLSYIDISNLNQVNN